MRKSNKSWNKLTLGEKVLKVIITLVKIAAVAVAGLTVAGVALAVAAGIFIAFAIAGAISSGIADERYAYRYDGRYLWR